MREDFNSETTDDLSKLFSWISHSKAAIKAGEVAKVKYALVINKLSDITAEDSETGEELAKRATELLKQIEAGEAEKEPLQLYLKELEEFYGIEAAKEAD